jgi:hypothetical protein
MNIQQICLLEIADEWNEVDTPWSVKTKWIWEAYTCRKVTMIGKWVYLLSWAYPADPHSTNCSYWLQMKGKTERLMCSQTLEASFSDSVSLISITLDMSQYKWVTKKCVFQVQKRRSHNQILIPTANGGTDSYDVMITNVFNMKMKEKGSD